MLSNRALHAGMIGMGHELGAHPYSTFLAVTPLFHIGSQVGLSCTYLGGTLVQTRRFDAGEFVEALERTKTTHTQLVPSMVRMVLDAGTRGADSSLQRILYGAAPMPPALLREALDAWGCEFVNGYGSTESTGISALAPHEHDPERLPHLLSSVGRSFALSVPRLADEDDRDVEQGEIGEVLARSAAMMSGYWRNPEATEEALRGGFMHTGDLAYRDEDGYLYLVDRRNDKIVTGGENVYPSEIEHVLSTHPAVQEAGVIGVPDRTWGEAVSAVIVVRDGDEISVEELSDHCRALLARYKVPKKIVFTTEELPRTPTGKLLRRELRRTWPAEG
jgi:acyl-CoA synthetase (AMP-forming)/AMP-acid ligase II